MPRLASMDHRSSTRNDTRRYICPSAGVYLHWVGEIYAMEISASLKRRG